jgi:hypothetical protein
MRFDPFIDTLKAATKFSLYLNFSNRDMFKMTASGKKLL